MAIDILETLDVVFNFRETKQWTSRQIYALERSKRRERFILIMTKEQGEVFKGKLSRLVTEGRYPPYIVDNMIAMNHALER